MVATTAEAESEATREAQKAGIAHAKAAEPHSYRGRKASFDRAQLGMIRNCLRRTPCPTAIAEAAGMSRQVVYRVQDDPAKAESMLAEWDLGREQFSTHNRFLPLHQRRCYRALRLIRDAT
jgi:putative DNA-invertase from lambdoid prophage Rac